MPGWGFFSAIKGGVFLVMPLTVSLEAVEEVSARFTNLKRLKVPKDKAWQWVNTRKGYWRIAHSWILTRSLTNKYLASIGYDDISQRYEALHSSH